MPVNQNIFREYDIRGRYPQELNENVVERIAAAFIKLYPKATTIVVSQDTRKSSPFLVKAINKILLRAGKTVIFLGVAPDPLFYFSILHYGFDAGIMISGSHNPKEYNGLTLNIQKTAGDKKGDVVLRELEKIKQITQKIVLSRSVEKLGKIKVFDPVDDYIDFVCSKIKLSRPLKILIDSGNGAMGFLPQKVFERLGCKVKTLYGKFDSNFPHHLPDPYERKNRLAAKKAVLKGGFDLGFVYDGDGDRVAAIDNRGRSVAGDFCFLMLARQALQKRKGSIVHDMRVSRSFLDEMKKRKVKTYFSVSHHTAIIKKIKEKKAIFGGEVTLHFLFPKDYYLCDEALFASLKLAEIASAQKDFALYIDALPRYSVSPEVFLPCADEKKFGIIKNLQSYLRKEGYDFINIDGARINFPRGWALARAANTTPYIKCRFEGETKEWLEKIEREALAIFKQSGIPITDKTYKQLGLPLT